MDVIVADCLRQKPDGLHFSVVLSIRKRFQLCSRTRGTSVGLRTSKQHLRRCRGYLVCGRILRPLQLRVSSGAMHLLAAFVRLELLGCLQYLLRADNKFTNIVMTYKIPATGRATQQMATLSITNSTTCNTICIDMWANVCAKGIHA